MTEDLYSTSTQTYSLVSGFPISLPLTGIGTTGSGKIYANVALDQDSTGKLWATYSGGGLGGDGNVRVIWSTSADHLTWDTNGFMLASGVSTDKTEATAILRFGTNKIGVRQFASLTPRNPVSMIQANASPTSRHW